MGVRDILLKHGKKLASSLLWRWAAMHRAALVAGSLLAACALGGCAPALAAQAPATAYLPAEGDAPPLRERALTHDGPRPPRRVQPGNLLANPDDPRDPIFPGALAILVQAQARVLPILRVIKATPNLSPRQVEAAAATGTLTNFSLHPGSTFLGAVGEALIINDIMQNVSALATKPLVVPEPDKSQLPAVLSKELPDLKVTQDGFVQTFVGLPAYRQHVDWTDTVGPSTGGLVSTVSFGPNKVVSYWEVTTSTRFQKIILPRGQKVARWATALSGSSPPHMPCSGGTIEVAVLAIDRATYFNLSAADRMNLVNTVTGAGGYIRLFRNFAGNSVSQAMTLSMQLKPVSRP